jgi:hypothetical protein
MRVPAELSTGGLPAEVCAVAGIATRARVEASNAVLAVFDRKNLFIVFLFFITLTLGAYEGDADTMPP